MNKFYKVVFCKATGTMKAVSETAKSGKKTKSVSIAVSVLSAGIVFSGAALADTAVGDPIVAGQATGANSIAIGETTTVTGQNSFGAGITNTVEGDFSTVVGNDNGAKGTQHTAFGSNNNITDIPDPYNTTNPLRPSELSTAIGIQNNIAGSYSSSVGYSNSSEGEYNTTIGSANEIRSKYEQWSGRFIPNSNSTAIGSFNQTDSDRTVAVGYQNRANADNSTVVGGENNVTSQRGGAYGSNNYVSSNGDGDFSVERFATREVSDFGINQARAVYIQEGSYAYGNSNDVSGSRSHAVGNSNSVNGDKNGLLGNGNSLTNGSGGFEIPTILARQATGLADLNDGVITNSDGVIINDGFIPNNDGVIVGAPRAINLNPVGSFLVGNQNNVNGDNTHAVGNSNEISNDNNVTLGSNNSVNYREGNENNNPPLIITPAQNQRAAAGSGAQPSSTAIVGDGNTLRAGGVHIVGTENFVEQQNSYVVGGNNVVEYQSDLLNDPFETESGSNVLGSNNSVVSKGATVSGDNNYVAENSVFSTVSGSQNRTKGIATSLVGNGNEVRKDVGGAFGVANNVRGNVDFANALANAVSDDGEFLGVDIDGDGVIDFTDMEQAQAVLILNGSYAYGNANQLTGEALHVVGTANQVDGDNSGSFGSGNRLGTAAFFSGNGDAMTPAVKANNSFAYGNGNTIDANESQAIGNKNAVNRGYSTAIGSGNIISESLNGELVDATEDDLRRIGTFAYGNNNEIDSNGGHVTGNNNQFQADDATAAGNNNTVIGDQGHVIGNNNLSIGNDNKIIGNRNTAGMDMNGDYSSRNSVIIMGDENQVSGNGSTAVGNSNNVSGRNSIAVGTGHTITGDNSGSFGDPNVVDGNDSYVYGNDNTLSGNNSHVIGNNNNVASDNSLVLGNNVVLAAEATDSIILGSGGSSTVAGGIAIGNNSVSDRANSVSVGSAGAERQVTNVADGTQDKDAVNLGQLNAAIVPTTAGKNIGVTRTDLGYEVALNDTVALTSVTTGATSMTTDGVRAGDVFLSSTTGLDNAGNKVTNVGNATVRSDAVNYGQFEDGLAGTIKSVTGDENITATTDANKNVSLALSRNIDADSITFGSTVLTNSSFNLGAITIDSDGGINSGGFTIKDVGDAVELTDAVNLGQVSAIDDRLTTENVTQTTNITNNTNAINQGFNVGNGVTSNKFDLGDTVDITAGKNSKVNTTATGVEVAVADDITLNTVTTGATSMTTDGVRAGDVFLSSTTGLDNAGNRVTNVGNATVRSDAVNYGQFEDGLAGTIKSVTGDENITATTDANKNVTLNLKKDLTADSLTAGNTVINNAGFTNGATNLGGNGLTVGAVTVSNTGLDNAGNRVTNVGDAVEGSDAVNFDQFKAGLTDTTAGKNIVVKRTDSGYEVSTVEDMALTSVTTGTTSMTTDGVRAGDVFLSSTTGLDNAGNKVTNVGNATVRSDAVNYGQFEDGLAGTIKSVTGDENITATTDANKNVVLNLSKNLNADSLTTGNTVINNAGFTNGATNLGGNGLTVGAVTVSNTGLDNAGNRVTNVGNAIEGTDAINLDQFKAGLTDTTAGKNIVVKRTDTGYEVGTVEDMTLTSVTTGATSMTTDGVRAGDVFLSSTTGLDNAGNKVTNVGNATVRSDAVNYGQFEDGLAGTIKSVTGDENITATTDANKNVTLNLKKDLTADSLTAGNTVINNAGFTNGATNLGGNGLTVGAVTVSNTGLDNAGNRVTNVGDAVERSDAVNFGQFTDGISGLGKTTVDGDANIIATKNDTGYDLALNRNLTAESVTTGATSMTTDGVRAGDVFLSSTTGLDNAGNKVTNVGNATVRSDAVNYGQFEDGLAGTIKSVTGDENITATTDANKNVTLNLKKDLTADSLTAGNTVINNAGFTNGATNLGGNGLTVGAVTVSNTGLDNAGNRVTNVGDAVEVTDAVNLKQLNASLRDTTGDENITATQTETGYNVALNKNVNLDSVTAGNTLVNNDGMTVGDTFFGATGVQAGNVILSNKSGLYNGGYRVTGVARAEEGMDAVNFDQFNEALNNIAPTNIKGDSNVTVTNTGAGYDIGLNKDLTAESLTTGNTTINNQGVTTGDVTVSSNGLSNGGNRVTNIGDAVEGSDAVSFDQFNKKFEDIAPTNIKGDSNITVSKNEDGFEVALNKDITADSITVGDTSITSDGLAVGGVSVTANGLNNGGNTIQGVGAGIKLDDAVNLGQLKEYDDRQTARNDQQDIIINNKLDKSEFIKDQQRQDEALKGKADKAELDKTNVNVSNNTTNITKNTEQLKDHSTELVRLEDVKADKAELEKTNVKVQDNANKNKDQDKTLGEHKTELERLEDVKADKKDLEVKADKDYVDKENAAQDNRFTEINKENNSKYEKFEKSQSTIDSSQNVRIGKTEQAISDLGYQVDNLEDKLSAGIASTVALASMPSAFKNGEARLAGGFGYYNGQNAVAIGITGATETGDYSYKLGSSYTQEGGAVVGAGISYRLW